MNEITEVRALRDDAPLSSEERLAAQRRRLIDAARVGTAGVDRPGASTARVRTARAGDPAGAVSRPYRRTLLGTAAVAVITAVTCTVVVLPDHDQRHDQRHDPHRGRSEAGSTGPLPADGSAAALQLAAATVGKSTVTEPKPKQWVYEKSYVQLTADAVDTKKAVEQPPQEQWTRWDGTGSARLPGMAPSGPVPKDFDPNKLQVWYGPNQEEKWKKEGYDDRSQRQFWRFLSTLPSDSDAMMERIREKHAIGDIPHETPAQRDWREIEVLFRSVLIPPNVQAGVYRALAKIPGVRVEKGVKDPLGRDAIKVFVNYPKRIASGAQGRQEIYLDPKTYVYLGQRSGAGTEQETAEARAAWGVVDKPGGRP